jgi:metal-responsive CopG/Arc/MetJ family transcriptional regulator
MASTSDEDSTVRTTVTIPKNDYDEIEKIARDKRVSVAWVVREAVADYLSGSTEATPKSASKKGGKK